MPILKYMPLITINKRNKCYLCDKVSTTGDDIVNLCEEHYYEFNNKYAYSELSNVIPTLGNKNIHGNILSSRTFGIEFECTTPRIINQSVALALTPPEFGFGSDCTVSGNGIGSTSTEIRTCKLVGLDGENIVIDMCKKLKDLKYTVNDSCGTHVHIGIPEAMENNCDTGDETEKKLKNLFLFYNIFEPCILSLLPPSRRSNRFCSPFRNAFMITLTNKTKKPCGIFKDKARFDHFWWEHSKDQKISKDSLLSSKRNGYTAGNRYLGINFSSIYRRGALEIRYHQGTIDANQIIHWIAFHSAIVDLVMSGSISETKICGYAKVEKLEKLFEDLLLLLSTKINSDTLDEIKKRFKKYKKLNPPNGYIIPIQRRLDATEYGVKLSNITNRLMCDGCGFLDEDCECDSENDDWDY